MMDAVLLRSTDVLRGCHMPLVRHREEINASVDAIWSHLMRKIEKPEQYVPAAVRSEILGRPGAHSVDRLMVLRDEHGQERPTREIITADRATLTVIFKLMDNPVFTGLVTNSVILTKGAPVFDITMNWLESAAMPEVANVDWQAMVTDAVLQTKFQVEAEAFAR